jgi:hypothetical protein
MTPLVKFYRGEGRDSEGRLLSEIWGWGNQELEDVHDFIQWLFPLPEPSRFNSDAPLVTKEDVAAFEADERLRANLLRSLERMLAFLGLAWAEDGEVVEGSNFAARARDVWSSPNHNWLRITRILHCLRLFGLNEQARALYRRLDALYQSRKYPIPAETFRYWTEAVEGTPFDL